MGDTDAEPVDIRVLAATNRDLEAEIKAGRFREDLYYRLNVVTSTCRRCASAETTSWCSPATCCRYAPEYGAWCEASRRTPSCHRSHRWPGNIRELENRIKKAVVLADKALLGPEDLDLSADELPTILPLADAKEKFQRDYINEVLTLNNGNRTKTAREPRRRPAHHLPPSQEGRHRDRSRPDHRERSRRSLSVPGLRWPGPSGRPPACDAQGRAGPRETGGASGGACRCSRSPACPGAWSPSRLTSPTRPSRRTTRRSSSPIPRCRRS